MKITKELRSQVDSSMKNNNTRMTSSKSFDSVMSAQSQKLKGQELQYLISEITKQGEKIARFRSFQDLAKYKRMVKDFVQEAIQYGLKLKHGYSWNIDGDNRKLTLVTEVDEKLTELTERVMENEKNSIGILHVIGEIKGLLINLYK